MEINNESSSPDLNSTTSPPAVPPPDSGYQKLKGYVGVLVVLVIAGFLLLPSKSGDRLGRSLNNEKSYILNTTLSEFVGDNWRATFFSYVVYSRLECKQANASIKKFPKDTFEQSVNNACDPYPVLDPDFLLKERPPEIDGEYLEGFKELTHLRDAARKEQGLERLESPKPTQEMLTLQAKLSPTMERVIANVLKELQLLNWGAHGLVALLAYFGLWYRRGLGAILLAPFGWIFSFGKGVHEKI